LHVTTIDFHRWALLHGSLSSGHLIQLLWTPHRLKLQSSRSRRLKKPVCIEEENNGCRNRMRTEIATTCIQLLPRWPWWPRGTQDYPSTPAVEQDRQNKTVDSFTRTSTKLINGKL
jgi:hypothetical protein